MKSIPLTQGQFALVDDEDFEYLNQFRWRAQWNNGTKTYYATRHTQVNYKRKTIHMHREVAHTPDKMDCDHRDGNTLNNTVANLRNCTRAQNTMNKKIHSNNKSGYKGVSQRGSKWRAQLSVGGVKMLNKTFLTKQEAAKAYDEVASIYFGEFARLNLE